MLMGRLFHSGICNWRYHTEPVPALDGRRRAAAVEANHGLAIRIGPLVAEIRKITKIRRIPLHEALLA